MWCQQRSWLRKICSTLQKERLARQHGGRSNLNKNIESSFRDHYAELLALARSRLSREKAPISTGTLAHELYLNLQGRNGLRFETMEQFLAYASRAMRSLLVDMARERIAQKRSAELLPLTLCAEVADRSGTPEQILLLDQAFERLGQVEPRLLQVAEMRAVMGMEVPAIAAALSLSEPTIKRDWQRGKAFLYEALGVPLG
jgi:RNA polymerase sigma factor (TIGR02999 family)